LVVEQQREVSINAKQETVNAPGDADVGSAADADASSVGLKDETVETLSLSDVQLLS
jgi:hypothetical protein